MMIRPIIIMLALSLQACSPMDLISLVKPSKGLEVDAELTIGDKSESIKADVTAKKEITTNTAETLTQNTSTIHNGMSISETILSYGMTLLFGWLGMPSARQMWLSGKKRL